jgi:aminoglycoside adenylyltransferase-like protein/nucleotidyltransferase-like protein
MDDPRALVAELAGLLEQELGSDLLGLYLFGSLAAGGFVEGRSDIDLLAVLARDVDEDRLAALERLHGEFAAAHPEWIERVEVGYLGRSVLQTLSDGPRGTIAVISPGEPLNIKPVGWDWVLNWDGAVRRGEILRGPRPLDVGPPVSEESFRRAVTEQLRAWPEHARRPELAYVPAAQGYTVVTVCRALYACETGEQTTKEAAAAWAAARYPEWADFIREALAAHRADLAGAHARTVAFVDFAAGESG